MSNSAFLVDKSRCDKATVLRIERLARKFMVRETASQPGKASIARISTSLQPRIHVQELLRNVARIEPWAVAVRGRRGDSIFHEVEEGPPS